MDKLSEWKQSFYKLKGKKLLYLGGITRAAYVVQRAKELGIYVIVADYNEDSPAKKVANEGVLVDATDIEALTNLCKERNVEGIMTGYADILLPICHQVAQKVGIPYYTTEEMIQAATDKGYFKKICSIDGLPVPLEYGEEYQLPEEKEKLTYPVFIKPLDASGSRGADMCRSEEEFEEKYQYALRFSKKKKVVVEELLVGTEFILDYLLIDGEPHLLSMADRYMSEGRGPAVNSCNLMVLPSRFLDHYSRDIDPKVRAMFKRLGFKNGLIFMQGFGDQSRITFYEMGCRLGGTWPYVDEFFTGLNPMDALFCHALTGKMLPEDVEVQIDPFFRGNAAIIYFVSQYSQGTISCIKGLKEMEEFPWVVNVMQFYSEGEHFDVGRQTDVRFLSVHLVAENFTVLKERVKQIYALVDICDEQGKTLLMPTYNIDLLDELY